MKDSFYYEYERQGVKLALIVRECKPGSIKVARIDQDGSFQEPEAGEMKLLDHPNAGRARVELVRKAAQHWESWEPVMRELQRVAALRLVTVPAEA